MDITKLYVPLPVVMTIAISVAGGYVYLDNHYVSAGDFKQYQLSTERRAAEREARRLEAEILRLDVKQQTYPHKFDEVDRQLLRKYEADLREMKVEINQIKQEQRK